MRDCKILLAQIVFPDINHLIPAPDKQRTFLLLPHSGDTPQVSRILRVKSSVVPPGQRRRAAEDVPKGAGGAALLELESDFVAAVALTRGLGGAVFDLDLVVLVEQQFDGVAGDAGEFAEGSSGAAVAGEEFGCDGADLGWGLAGREDGQTGG